MRKIGAFLFLISIGLNSCKNDAEEKCAFTPDTSSIKVEVSVEQLQDSLPSFTSKAQLINFLTHHPELRDYFFNRPAYPGDSVFVNELFRRISSPHFDTLLLETKRIFGDLSELKQELNLAFSNLKYYYPDFKTPKVKTVITGLESDIFVNDSLVIIGLDYYLGLSGKYKPNMYEYMQRRYQKNFIAPSIMLLYGIDNQFNKSTPDDKSVLADMVTFGKAYYFAKQMLPCTPDSVFIGYTQEEIKGSRENEDLIWKRLIEDQVFYSTSHLIKQKYIAERPKTIEVGEKCPGRIGTWVGWQIVNKYMEKSKVSLPEMMNIPSAEKIFKDSKYKPDLR